MQQTMLQRSIEVIEYANQIAATTDLDTLLSEMLDLILTITESQAGILHLYDATSNELFFEVMSSTSIRQCRPHRRLPVNCACIHAALRNGHPVFIHDVTSGDGWNTTIYDMTHIVVRNIYCIPIIFPTNHTPVAVVQLFNLSMTLMDDPDELALLQLLCSRLATEVEKTRLLVQAQRRERRMHALVDIATSIVKNLQPDQLLDEIMLHARDLLEVEATSIWLRDEECKELVLYVAIGDRVHNMRRLRVPEDQGIIGYVISTGETIVVNDVNTSQHFYKGVDQQSGFSTRAILCVPLRAPSIQLGGELGEVPEMTIGGVQALNKRNGQPFSDEDVYLLAKLSGLAATILQFARLYEDTHTLFWGFVNAITSAIDSKDPWMRNHSKRVSDFSVAIAQELPSDWWTEGKLSQQMLYHIRVGSMLHDVGKIRVGDAILNKPDRLTDEEMEEMRKHPIYGVKLLDNEAQLGRILKDALPAILEHHERLNGCGYPRGLKGDQISRIGRIVAVADAFEAITSDRPYRQGQPVEQALQILLDAAGSEYDSACVQALVRIHDKGMVA